MVLSETTNKTFRGFRKGLDQVKVGDYKACVAELKKALGINNRNSFYAYLYGKVEPKATQAEAVTTVFAKYGVTGNIWGICD